jgi:hypothetical protein
MTVVLAATLLAGHAEAGAQQARLRVAENVRLRPQGQVIARLEAGMPVRVVATEGSWSQISFQGVVWAASLAARGQGSFDLVVSASGGENLRDAPQGTIVGRIEEGTLLMERGRRPGWIEVERTAWIWGPSLEQGPAPTARSGAPAPAAPTTPATRPAQPTQAARSAQPAGAATWGRARAPGVAILAAPAGDTLAIVPQGREVQILSEEGGWARVRLDGWVWIPGLQGASEGAGSRNATEVVRRDVTPRMLAEEPLRYRGRLIALRVQHISLERAEQIRTDFLEGEPFLLVRIPDAPRSFLYLAVPPEMMEEAARLRPLETLEVIGRVRTGAAALTGNPVLDLVRLTPEL